MAVAANRIIIFILSIPGLAFFIASAKEGSSMEQLFKNPPHENRMLQIIHYYYSDKIAQAIDEFGYGGVVANVSHDDYLESEEQWETFLKCLTDFRKRGLIFWIYDEKGYPSGKAGGLTLRDHPEYEALGVLCARTEGEGTLRHKMPTGEKLIGAPVYVVAAPINNGQYMLDKGIDLTKTAQQGQSELAWDAPYGRWGMFSFHLNRMYEGTHCVANYSDTLPYINIMDQDAVARFIQLTHEAYKQRCGDALRDYVQAFFTDEPSLMTLYLKKDDELLPPIPWSRDFPEEFRSRCGYDIIPGLPYLFVDGGEETVYKRLDFWKVVARLIEERFYGQIQDWCRANGVASSGHALCEEQLFWHAAFEGNLYRDLRRMDIPGIDMLSSNPTQLAHANHIPVPKFVSSVAHIAGHKLCMSETSSFVQKISKQPCSFEQRIGTINWQYVLGLTCVTSYYGIDEFTHEERSIFNSHIGRLGLMLTGGKHVADVAVFYPIHSFWGCYTPTSDIAYSPPQGEKAQRINSDFGAVSAELLANQRDFDYIDDQAVLESQVDNGYLSISGESFKCVVLPNAWVIPVDVYQKLEEFINSGGSVVALGGLPDTGMGKDETPVVQAISRNLSRQSLHSERVAVVKSIPDVIKAINTFADPDVSLDKPCRELFYLHRRYDGRDIYFICNNLDTPIQREISLKCSGKLEMWHPTTGEIQTLDSEIKGDKTIVRMSLKAFEGVILNCKH